MFPESRLKHNKIGVIRNQPVSHFLSDLLSEGSDLIEDRAFPNRAELRLSDAVPIMGLIIPQMGTSLQSLFQATFPVNSKSVYLGISYFGQQTLYLVALVNCPGILPQLPAMF